MSRGNERHRQSAADINTITPVVGFRGNCPVKISDDDVVAQIPESNKAELVP